MEAGFRWLVQLLRVDVGERQVGASLIRMGGQEPLQFVRGVRQAVGLLQHQGEVVARIGGIRLDGKRVFVSGQSDSKVAGFGGRQGEVVLRLEEARVQSGGHAIRLDGVGQPSRLLSFQPLGEHALSFGAVPWLRGGWRPIVVVAEGPGGRALDGGRLGNDLLRELDDRFGG